VQENRFEYKREVTPFNPPFLNKRILTTAFSAFKEKTPARSSLLVPLFIEKISYEIALAMDQGEHFDLVGENFVNETI
jgi:hypothetical protein